MAVTPHVLKRSDKYDQSVARRLMYVCEKPVEQIYSLEKIITVKSSLKLGAYFKVLHVATVSAAKLQQGP